tara:strand:+ start:8263 stop:8490 length:228 start_codon:yes stop_codon:yes gene_type:complete
VKQFAPLQDFLSGLAKNIGSNAWETPVSIKPLFSDLEHLPQAKVEKHGIKTTYFIKSLLHGPTQYAIWMTKGAQK